MNLNNPPRWLRFFYSSFHWKINSEAKNIYLTFDDGPTPEITEWVLNELEAHKAKATFFCIGRNVERHPEIYAKILKAGHAVGNHTYSHLNGWKTDKYEYTNDVDLASEFIKPKLFRPPYGKIGHAQIRAIKKMGYRMYMWDVLSEDYNQEISPEQCLDNVLKYTSKGSIVVFHDSVKASPNLYYALPQVLKFFKEKGYNFQKLK